MTDYYVCHFERLARNLSSATVRQDETAHYLDTLFDRDVGAVERCPAVFEKR